MLVECPLRGGQYLPEAEGAKEGRYASRPEDLLLEGAPCTLRDLVAQQFQQGKSHYLPGVLCQVSIKGEIFSPFQSSFHERLETVGSAKPSQLMDGG